MYPSCNQLTKICGAAKTHKFNNTTEININDLKFRPIIDQTNTYTNDAAKVISEENVVERSRKCTIKNA